MFFQRIAACLAAIPLLASCTATTKDVNFVKHISIPSTNNGAAVDGIASDAKQRFVWMPVSVTTTVEGEKQVITERRLVCAEPSPDVMSALSSSFAAAAKLSIASKGDIGGNLQKSMTESVTNIGKRTATIQLLRDTLYRACEAHANGMLDKFGYALILSKVDNLIIQLISIEALERGGTETMTPEESQKLDSYELAVGEYEVAKIERAVASTEKGRLEGEVAKHESALSTAKTQLISNAKRISDAETAATQEQNTLDGYRSLLEKYRSEKAEWEKDLAQAKDSDSESSFRSNHPEPIEPVKSGDSESLAAYKRDKAEAEAKKLILNSEVTTKTPLIEQLKTKLSAADGKLSGARLAEEKAKANVVAAQKSAERAKPKLKASAVKAILDINAESHAKSTLQGACMMYFASQGDKVKVSDLEKSNINNAPAIAYFCAELMK